MDSRNHPIDRKSANSDCESETWYKVSNAPLLMQFIGEVACETPNPIAVFGAGPSNSHLRTLIGEPMAEAVEKKEQPIAGGMNHQDGHQILLQCSEG